MPVRAEYGHRRTEHAYVPLAIGLALALISILYVSARRLPGESFNYEAFAIFMFPATLIVCWAWVKDPKLMAYVYVVAMVFSPRMSAGFAGGRSLDLRIEDFIFVGMFLWLIIASLKPRWEWPAKWPIFLYLGLAFISTVLGIARYLVPTTRATLFFLRDVEYIGVFLVVAHLFRSKVELENFLKFALAISAVVPIYAMWQLGHGETYPVFPLDPSGRPQIGGFCLAFLILALVYWMEAATPKLRYFLLVVFGMHVAGIVGVASRTFFIAMIIAVVYTVYIAFKYKFAPVNRLRILAITVVAAIAIGYILPETQLGRRLEPLWTTFVEKGAVRAINIDARARMIPIWIKQGSKHLLIGGGKGWGPGGPAAMGSYPLADCGWTRSFGEVGLLGLGAFLGIMFCFLRDSRNMMRRTRLFTIEHILATMAGVVIMAYMATAVTAEPFYATKSAESFWLLMGVMYAAMRLSGTGWNPRHSIHRP